MPKSGWRDGWLDGRHIIMDVIVRPTLIPLDDREFGETTDRAISEGGGAEKD